MLLSWLGSLLAWLQVYFITPTFRIVATNPMLVQLYYWGKLFSPHTLLSSSYTKAYPWKRMATRTTVQEELAEEKFPNRKQHVYIYM